MPPHKARSLISPHHTITPIPDPAGEAAPAEVPAVEVEGVVEAGDQAVAVVVDGKSDEWTTFEGQSARAANSSMLRLVVWTCTPF